MTPAYIKLIEIWKEIPKEFSKIMFGIGKKKIYRYIG